MLKKTRKAARARQQLLSMLMAIIFVFTLTSVAFAAEVTDVTTTTSETVDPKIELGDEVEEIPEVVDPEEKWTLHPIGEQRVRIKKGQVYQDPGVVLVDENGNVEYICIPDKVGVTVLDQTGARHRDLEAGFMKIGTVASQYEGSYTLLYAFRGKITFRVVQVSKDLKELPEGKNAPADSLKFFLKLKDNHELVVKKGQAVKDSGVQVYDQYWKEHKELESKVTKSALDMEKLGYQILKYELNGKTVYGLVRIVDQSKKLTLKFDDKNVNSQNKMRVGVGSKIVLPEAKILDSSGKEQTELEKQVVIRGNFDTAKAGTYTMVYDLDGVQLTLTIEVVKNLRATSDDSGSSSSSGDWKPPVTKPDDPTPPVNPDDPKPEDPGKEDPKPEDPGKEDPKPEDPGKEDPNPPTPPVTPDNPKPPVTPPVVDDNPTDPDDTNKGDDTTIVTPPSEDDIPTDPDANNKGEDVTVSDDTSTGDTPADDTSTGDTPAGDTPAGDTPAGDASAGNASADDIPTDPDYTHINDDVSI